MVGEGKEKGREKGEIEVGRAKKEQITNREMQNKKQSWNIDKTVKQPREIKTTQLFTFHGTERIFVVVW